MDIPPCFIKRLGQQPIVSADAAVAEQVGQFVGNDANAANRRSLVHPCNPSVLSGLGQRMYSQASDHPIRSRHSDNRIASVRLIPSSIAFQTIVEIWHGSFLVSDRTKAFRAGMGRAERGGDVLT